MAELDRGDVRLRRIFEQIDLAATPASAAPRRSLARWQRFRAGQAAPTLAPPRLRDAAEPLPEELIGVTDHRGRDWRVHSAGATARRQLGRPQDLARFTDLYELSMMRVYRAFRMGQRALVDTYDTLTGVRRVNPLPAAAAGRGGRRRARQHPAHPGPPCRRGGRTVTPGLRGGGARHALR